MNKDELKVKDDFGNIVEKRTGIIIEGNKMTDSLLEAENNYLRGMLESEQRLNGHYKQIIEGYKLIVESQQLLNQNAENEIKRLKEAK